MEFEGTYEFAKPRAQVWRALNNPKVLQAAIPGCEDVSVLSPKEFEAHIALRFGLLRFKTKGNLQLEIIEDASSYRLHGQSAQTLFGQGQGVSDVRLRDAPSGGTSLSYAVKAELSGRLATLGAQLVSRQIAALGDKFFARIEAAMDADL